MNVKQEHLKGFKITPDIKRWPFAATAPCYDDKNYNVLSFSQFWNQEHGNTLKLNFTQILIKENVYSRLYMHFVI